MLGEFLSPTNKQKNLHVSIASTFVTGAFKDKNILQKKLINMNVTEFSALNVPLALPLPLASGPSGMQHLSNISSEMPDCWDMLKSSDCVLLLFFFFDI